MKSFVKLFSFVAVALILTSSAFAYFSSGKSSKHNSGYSSEYGDNEGQAVFATHGKNVYWLTASIDEYENKSGSLNKVEYAK